MLQFLKRHPILLYFFALIATFPLVFVLVVSGFSIYESSTGQSLSQAKKDWVIILITFIQWIFLNISVASSIFKTRSTIKRILLGLLLVVLIGIAIAMFINNVLHIPA